MTSKSRLILCAAFLTFLSVGLLCKSAASDDKTADGSPDSQPTEKTQVQQQSPAEPAPKGGISTVNTQANGQGETPLPEVEKNDPPPDKSKSNDTGGEAQSSKQEIDARSADKLQPIPSKEDSTAEGANGSDLPPGKTEGQGEITLPQPTVEPRDLRQMKTPPSEHIRNVALLVLGVILLFLVWKVLKRLLSIKPDQNMKSDARLDDQAHAQAAPPDLPEVDNETLKQIIDPICKYMDQRFGYLEHSLANNGQAKQVEEFIKQQIAVCQKGIVNSLQKNYRDAVEKHDSVIQRFDELNQFLRMQVDKNEEKDKQIATLTQEFKDKTYIEALRYFCRTLCSYREKLKEHPDNAVYKSICKKLDSNLQCCDVEEFKPDKQKRYHELKDAVQDSPEEQITNNEKEKGYIAEVIEQGFRFSMDPEKIILGARVKVYRYEEPRE